MSTQTCTSSEVSTGYHNLGYQPINHGKSVLMGMSITKLSTSLTYFYTNGGQFSSLYQLIIFGLSLKKEYATYLLSKYVYYTSIVTQRLHNWNKELCFKITMKWDCKTDRVNISIPEYVHKILSNTGTRDPKSLALFISTSLHHENIEKKHTYQVQGDKEIPQKQKQREMYPTNTRKFAILRNSSRLNHYQITQQNSGETSQSYLRRKRCTVFSIFWFHTHRQKKPAVVRMYLQARPF